MKLYIVPLLSAAALVGCGSDSNNNSSAPQPIDKETTPPEISSVFPAGGHAVQTRVASIKGMAKDNEKLASVQVSMGDENVEATLDQNGNFVARLTLNPGSNSYKVTATDAAGNTTVKTYITYFGKQVAAGNSHTAVIKDGKTYTWGRNNFGQNGLGFVSDPYKDLNKDQHPTAPKLIPGDTQFVSVTYDQNTSVAMTANGQVWTWGYGKYGQLGLGSADSSDLNEEDKNAPTQITSVTDAVAVTRGYDLTMILHNDGTVSTFGSNRYGQLGDGTSDDRDMPTKLSGLANIVQIASGGSFAIAVDADGQMWSWGRNNYGQLGLGTIDSDPHSSPVQIPLDVKIESVALGKGHALALARNGEVYGWGLNFSSQVGKYDRNNEDPDWPKDISSPKKLPWFKNAHAVWANGNQSFAERADGKVYPWGQNMLGTLGVEQDGDVKEPGSPVFGFDKVVDLGNGALHTIGLRQDGNVFTWGWSFQGSLGGGDSTIDRWSYRVPTLVSLPAAQ
ncbi:hypothetical protein [Bacterioplanoides sp.]|uniref:RCC1 domain-containing protein n=1 Tax=Bacterioplanoides sp. TaxID=2066072 RepID=UPI003B5A79E1